MRDIRVRSEPLPPQPKRRPLRTRIGVDVGVGTAFRRLCKLEEMSADEMLEVLVRYWIEHVRPEYEVVEVGVVNDYQAIRAPRRKGKS